MTSVSGKMLWFKAWRETRIRLALSAAIVTTICSYAVLFPDANLDGRIVDFHGSVYHRIYFGTAKGVFGILLIFLGLSGSLLREQARNTAALTLSLPISRTRLVVVPFAVGLSAMAALCLIPASLLQLTSVLADQNYSLVESLQLCSLWFGFGAPIFALSFFLSAVTRGDFVAPVATWLLVVLNGYVAAALGVREMNLLAAMSGRGTVSSGPFGEWPISGLPWGSLLIALTSASLLLVISIVVTNRRDY